MDILDILNSDGSLNEINLNQYELPGIKHITRLTNSDSDLVSIRDRIFLGTGINTELNRVVKDRLYGLLVNKEIYPNGFSINISVEHNLNINMSNYLLRLNDIVDTLVITSENDRVVTLRLDIDLLITELVLDSIINRSNVIGWDINLISRLEYETMTKLERIGINVDFNIIQYLVDSKLNKWEY